MKVIKAQRREDWSIVLHVEENGVKKEIQCQGLRGGISWAGVSATDRAPHYFCVVAQDLTPKPFEGQQKQQGVIRLVAEHQAESLLDMTDFFRRLTDTAVQFCYPDWYADTRGEREDEETPYIQALKAYVSDNKIERCPYIYPAPFIENFTYGMEAIEAKRKKHLLEIDTGTIAYEQLCRLTEDDLIGNNFPQIRFYAVNALRHAICSLEKSGLGYGKPYSPNRARIRQRRV